MREFTHPFEAIEAALGGEAVRLLTDSGPLIISPPVITSGDPLVAEVLAVPPAGGLAVTLDADAVAFLDIVRMSAAQLNAGVYSASQPPLPFPFRMTFEHLAGVLAQLPACITCMDTGERCGADRNGAVAWCHCPAGELRADHAESPGGRRC
jgi:hypothetical protein